jgi:hypothetical protein
MSAWISRKFLLSNFMGVYGRPLYKDGDHMGSMIILLGRFLHIAYEEGHNL